MLRKLSRTMATVVTLSALVVVSQAGAATKLQVNGTDGSTPVFQVDDSGTFQVPNAFKFDNTSKFIGIGTTSPTAGFHLNYKTAFPPFLLERELDNLVLLQ